MMKIEITKEGVKHSVERENDDLSTSFQDFINLLFIVGYEPEDIEKLIEEIVKNTKQNHKNEPKTFQNTCSL